MDTLFSSYTNLGSKLPKNDATITRKKDDATVKQSFHNQSELESKVLFRPNESTLLNLIYLLFYRLYILSFIILNLS